MLINMHYWYGTFLVARKQKQQLLYYKNKKYWIGMYQAIWPISPDARSHRKKIDEGLYET